MKIVSVDVRDFRSIESAALSFDKVNWVFGHNRAGKSSLLAAISSCLIGKGESSVVRHGAKSSKVAMKVLALGKSRDIEITRYRSKVATPRVDGQPIKRASYHSILEETLGVELPVLEALMEPSAFMSMDSKGQVESVLSALGCKVDWDGCQGLFDSWCEEKGVPQFKLANLVASVSRISGFELLSLIRDSAYAARREARKLAEDMNVSEPKIPADVTQYVRDDRLFKGVSDEVVDLRKRVSSLESKIDMFRQVGQAAEPKVDVSKRAWAIQERDRLTKLKEEKDSEAKRVKALESELDAARDKYKSLMSGTCPYCGVSGMDKMKELLDRLKAESLQKKELLGEAREKLVSGYPEKMSAEILRLAELVQEIDAEKERSTQRERMLKEIAGADRASLELSYEQAVGRLSVVKKIVEGVRKHQSDVATFEMKNKQHKKIASREAKLDTIVKAFEKEIPVRVVSDLKEKFEEPFRLALRRFFASDDVDVLIQADSKFSISIVFGKDKRSFADLSQSERLVVGAAAQHAMAQSSEASILMIDAADILQGDLRRSFVKGIYSVADQYETIVIASAIGRVDIRSSPLKGFKDTRLFLVEEGTVSPV